MDLLTSQTAQTDYLSLLTVQLQNQDPIDPVDQDQFISDLTQFSILEGIEGLNASFEQIRQLEEISQGLALVGKQVQFLDPASGEVVSGTVDELFIAGNQFQVSVDGQSISIGSIIAVGTEPEASPVGNSESDEAKEEQQSE